jgi:type II secretion system (T2SS) protein M
MFEMFKKLSRRDQIALGIGAGGVVLYLLLSFGVLPLFEQLGASTESNQQKVIELRREKRLVAAEGIEKTSLTTAREHLKSLEAGLLEGSTPSLASAEWQQLVAQLAESKGIELGSSELLHTQELGRGYSLVTGRVQFRCRLDQLVDFVVALSGFPKILSVTGLSVTAVQSDPQGRLIVRLTIGAAARAVAQAKEGNAVVR